jgi:hypothetical protein
MKLTFRATGMNWTMSKMTMMNTESMTTIPPPVQTLMIMSTSQLINKIDTVAIQNQKAWIGLVQIPSRCLTDFQEIIAHQTSEGQMETILGCWHAHNHLKALCINLLAEIPHSLFPCTMPDGGLPGVGIPKVPFHISKMHRGWRATRIARCHCITMQLSI